MFSIRCTNCKGTGLVVTDFEDWLLEQGWTLAPEEQEMSELVTPDGKVMPTIGRVVHYKDVPMGSPLPATVIKVYSGPRSNVVDLVVFGLNGVASQIMESVKLVHPGDDTPEDDVYCCWPPRV